MAISPRSEPTTPMSASVRLRLPTGRSRTTRMCPSFAIVTSAFEAPSSITATDPWAASGIRAVTHRHTAGGVGLRLATRTPARSTVATSSSTNGLAAAATSASCFLMSFSQTSPIT